MCQFQLDTPEVTVTTQCLADVTVVSDRSISSSHGPLFKGSAQAVIPAANLRIKVRPTRDQCRAPHDNMNWTPNQGPGSAVGKTLVMAKLGPCPERRSF